MERRRFSVDELTARSYVFLVNQVSKVFLSLTASEDLIHAWIGENGLLYVIDVNLNNCVVIYTDGDMITVFSDEELMKALEYFN